MLILLLVLIICLYLGYELLNFDRVARRISLSDLPFSLHIGVLVYTVLVFVFSFLTDMTTVAVASLVFFPLTFLCFSLFLKKKIKLALPKKVDYLFVLLILIFGILISVLMSTHLIPKDSRGNLMTGESTYGDLPFHLSIINLVALGEVFPPENPFYGGLALVYPYFINFFSSILVTLGVELRTTILIPGIVLGINTIAVMYIFFKKLFRDKLTAFLSVILFMLQGGLGFYYFFTDSLGQKFAESFFVNPRPYPDYSHVFGENIQWANYLSRILVPERSVLLGIPMGLIILYFLFLTKTKDKNLFTWETGIAAVLTGLLPFSHTHTFLAFAVIIPLAALASFTKKDAKNWLSKWFIFGLIVLIVSAPALFIITKHTSGGR